MMTLRQLEILRSVIRCQTTVGAAREIGLSQPAVSNAIKNMEALLGFALFERVNGRLYPTKEASILYGESESIFSLHAALGERIQDLKKARAGMLRIVATQPLGYTMIPTVLKRFLSDRSKVRATFEVFTFDAVVDAIEKHVAEIGFVLGLADPSIVNSEVLFSSHMVCAFRPGHRLARKAVITPQDLRHEPFIALDSAGRLGSAVRHSFSEAGCPFNFVIEVRYSNTACVLADSGVGVAVVDPFTATCTGRFNLEVRPFAPAAPAVASVLWSKRRPLSRLAAAFIEQARQVAEELGSTLALPLPTEVDEE